MKRIVRWTGTIFGLVVFVLLVIIAWGTGMPMDHIATCSATIHRPPRDVFDAVEDDVRSTEWRTDVVKVERSTSPYGKPIWAETNHNGETVSYLEVLTYPGRLIDREIRDKTLPYGGEWKYAFRSDGAGGTRVSIIEFGVIYNPVFRFVERYFLGYTSTLRTFIADLGRNFGESPTVTCSARTMRFFPK